MARPYSLDLRARVVAQVARGMTHEEVAELNGIVSSTVSKWCRRERQTGSPAAKPMGGKRPRKLIDERDWLLARLAAKPDLTLHALLGELGARDVKVCCDTLWRFLRDEKISFKKNAARQRAGSP
jgi:transposase